MSDMSRKKSQILFNFLPQDTFNHSRNGTIGRVTWIHEDRDSEVKDLPVGYILRRIRPRIQQWPNDVPLRSGNVDVIAPEGAQFEVFPRVFECMRCGACTEVSQDQIESGRPATCGGCGRRLGDTEQLQFVVVCKCGRIDSMPVPSCSSCGDPNPQFVRPSSRLDDAYWQCRECNARFSDAYGPVYPCNYCGSNRRIKVHSSSTTFYPQLEKFVNIADENLEVVTNNENYQVKQIVDHLIGEEAGPTTPEEVDVPPQEVLDSLGVTEEEYREAQVEAAEQTEERRERLEEWVTESFSDDERRDLSEEIFEYQSLLGEEDSDVSGTTLTDLRDRADLRSDLDEAVMDRYVDQRRSLNLSEVRLVPDFPVTTVVYGYSRLESEPGEDAELNTFSGRRGGDRLYAQTTDAEAVMFRLDEEAVVDWLVANGVVDAAPEDDLDRWLLRRLSTYPYYDEIDGADRPVARHVLTLLHTFSHTVVDGIDALSGYAKSSLIEYLLPQTLSFVVYKHSDTDFSLGAMHTLVESRFAELHDYIASDADVCMYDPVCEDEENASCEGCLYISTLSCDNGNHNLSRSTLYGGRFDGDDIEGFLTHDA